MLAIHDGFAKCRFAELEKLGILPAGDRRRIQTKHSANCKGSVTEIALGHGHKPARSKNFIAASRTRLLLRIKESDAMKHKCPRTLLGHEHVVRSRVGFGGGSRG